MSLSALIKAEMGTVNTVLKMVTDNKNERKFSLNQEYYQCQKNRHIVGS